MAFSGFGRLVAGMATAAVLVGAGTAHAAFDPLYEARNFSKTTERFRYITGTPEYQLELRLSGVERQAQAWEIRLTDPERNFIGNLCQERTDGCAGDVRMYDWVTRGAGIALPVLFTARNGSTVSGHVWATSAGPAKRPGVVITNGSVQAPEELYWGAAQALAKAGYVVLTWDPQGQGYTDTFGAGTDRFDGFPSQTGQPFYDGTEDALDFFFSTPGSPYVPRRSCSSGTSHAAKQRMRVSGGKASAYNPLAAVLDRSRIGIAGHSLGASAVSYIGQIDPRVDAVVAWDNLRNPDGAGPECASGSSARPAEVTVRVPALGVSNDYGLLPQPNLSEPDPDGKTGGSRASSADGVDSAEFVIRGGTHYEPSVIPNPAFGGTLRGNDMNAWYTVAWMDRYVKGDVTAETRLLSDRWLADPRSAEVDPDGDANLLSRYHRSRIDIGRGGRQRVVCEDVRAACPALSRDSGAFPYDLVTDVHAREASPGVGPAADAAGAWTWSTGAPGSSAAPAAASGTPSGLTLGLNGIVRISLR